MNQFQDPTPLKDGCDPETCTERVGGDHGETCETSGYDAGGHSGRRPGSPLPLSAFLTESELRLMDGNR